MPSFKVSTLIKLAVACLVVGMVLVFVGADPLDLWRGLGNAMRDGVEWAFGTGWNGVATALRYMAVGAGVVLPIYGLRLAFKHKDRLRGRDRRAGQDLRGR